MSHRVSALLHLSVLVLITLSFLLAGCGDTASPPSPTPVASVLIPTAEARPTATQPVSTPTSRSLAPPPTLANATPLERVLEIKSSSLFSLQGLIIDQQGNIYAVQNRNGADPRIHKFDRDGKLVTSWGSQGSGEGEFAFRADLYGGGGIAVDQAGNVYVADTGNARIQKFDKDGKFLLQWGSRGDGEGAFNDPFGIAVSKQGFVYVGEVTRNVVQKFDTNGKFLAKWAETGLKGVPEDAAWLTVDAEENVYIPMYAYQTIRKFDPNGKLLTEFGNQPIKGKAPGPSGVAVDQAGNIYVTDILANRLLKYAKTGALLAVWGQEGSQAGEFNKPTGIAVDGAGNIYVAEYSGRRIQKFRQP